MRICQLMGGADDGGMETHFADLTNGLSTLGDTVSAIGHPRYQAGLDAEVRYLPLDLARWRRNPLLRRKKTRLRPMLRQGWLRSLLQRSCGSAISRLACAESSRGCQAPFLSTHLVSR